MGLKPFQEGYMYSQLLAKIVSWRAVSHSYRKDVVYLEGTTVSSKISEVGMLTSENCSEIS